MKKTILLALLLLGLCVGCGTEEASVSSVESAAESVEESVSDSAEDSVQETSAEESAVEEEEPTIDEQFASLTADAQGVCLKLQIYSQKGTPVRHGHVTLSAESGETITEDTDYSGYALILDLELDTEYAVTVTYEDESPVGTTSFTLQAGEGYAGGTSEETIRLEVGDGESSLVDLAITATDENGNDSGFTISRISAWVMPPEED